MDVVAVSNWKGLDFDFGMETDYTGSFPVADAATDSLNNPQPLIFMSYQLIIRKVVCCRSQWPPGLRRRSSAARLLRLWVRIPPGRMDVCCECCVLSGRGPCDGLITRPEKSYRLCRFVVCDQETSKTRRLKPATGL